MKTIIEMAREANEYADTNWALWPTGNRWKEIRDERFAALVRADEREAILGLVDSYAKNNTDLKDAIRARGNT